MQRVLITAGATGIGYALAEQFSDAGYQIWIIDISKEALGFMEWTDALLGGFQTRIFRISFS